jgi:hypothetical protein
MTKIVLSLLLFLLPVALLPAQAVSPRVDVAKTGYVNDQDLTGGDDDGPFLHGGRPYSGLVHVRHPDGSVMAVVNMMEGKRHGVTIAFYPNGSIMVVAEFWENLPTGVHTIWDEAGDLVAQIGYLRGTKLWARRLKEPDPPKDKLEQPEA